MPADSRKTDQLISTVIISDRFGERRNAPPRGSDAADPLPATLVPGDRLGRYVIVSRLGGGGMGIVYKAEDPELNRTVALKILPPHLCQHPDFLNRFRGEAQAQARFSSPYVITLYALMEVPAGEILVLEYVEGETLAARLRKQGALPVEEAVRIMEQALRGLEHIHKMGVVHRDLKPGNIFLTREGDVKIMDFGVAKLIDTPQPEHAGAMVGTLLYISPEQINGRQTDCRSDIYTLGITLFEAVTGRLPFERRSDYALMHAHVQESPPPPRRYQRQIPAALEWVILKAIEKDPQRRFQSAADFRTALLKAGILDRRGRGDTLKQIGPEGAQLKQELIRDRLVARNRLLGGLGFDAALIALLAVLVYALGLYPSLAPYHVEPVTRPMAIATPAEPAAASAANSSGPAEAPAVTGPPATPAAVAKARAPSAVQAKSTIPRPAPAKSSLPKAAPAKATPPVARKDKYEALRKAWGE